MKESYTKIYHLLGTGKLPRKNDYQKIVLYKFQMIVYKITSQAAFRCAVMVEIW